MRRSFSWVRREVDPIGIDFGDRSIRMIQLARHRGRASVIAHAERAYPQVAGTAEDRRAFQASAVAEMLASGGFAGREVVTAVPWSELHSRNLRIPTMPEDEIQEVVRYEAAERFGLDPERASVRFMTAGDVRQGNDVRQEVLVFVVEHARIQRHLDALAAMGLEPVGIDPGPCAVFRGFERFLRRDEDANRVNVYLDVGHAGSRVIIARGPDLIFYKAIPIGGARFDELVSDALNLSPSEAIHVRSRLRRQHIATLTGQTAQLDPDVPVHENVNQAVAEALRPALEQLGKEIGLCLRYCSVTFRGLRSHEITTVGGEASCGVLLRTLSGLLNTPVVIGRPLDGLAFENDDKGQERRTGQPEWATALGLALKRVPAETEVAA